MKIKTIETSNFEFENDEYTMHDYMFDDYCGLQKKIDEQSEKGFTHCFIHSTTNLINGEYNMNVGRSKPIPILWVRCRFLKSEKPDNLNERVLEVKRNKYLEQKKEINRLKFLN